MSTNTKEQRSCDKLAEAAMQVVEAMPSSINDDLFQWAIDASEMLRDMVKALAAHESAAEPARLTDEQRIDWLCEEAVFHCGQWQVVFDSDKDSFIDAIDEMAAIAHGIDASGGEVQK